ncbi:hypothetical protein AVEN_237539-1 [Araneus ventricosus]|uniref:Uncharacterized protein n=1 Tax=Araneus ventricosus TaxID=182803 RepID=A0A4Y2MU27_ARAVE|nr:hypothetical protein AVEN_237539-1 [Araneus ventricosus]
MDTEAINHKFIACSMKHLFYDFIPTISRKIYGAYPNCTFLMFINDSTLEQLPIPVLDCFGSSTDEEAEPYQQNYGDYHTNLPKEIVFTPQDSTTDIRKSSSHQ